MTANRTSSVRLAALVALGVGLVAVLLFVFAVFTSPAGVAVGAVAVCVAVGCGWLALTRSGGVRMLALIGGAKKSIRVYDEELSDSTIVTALADAAKRGVSVQVCGENQYGHYDRQFTELTDAGVKVTYFSSSHGFYIHAKVIEVDEGTSRAQMYVGSENFTTNSLRLNRELGIILTGKSVLSSVARTFAGDFSKATPFR